MSCITVDPFRCKVWDLHDRLDCYVNETSCKKEIDSFQQHGQLAPVLGRRLPPGSSHEIELICGARRLFVAQHLNIPLKVELRELSDREAVVAMDMENRQRTDISPYERGLSYARWLRHGHFESQEEIASTLNVSPAQVSRLLCLARLPSVIVGAFTSPLDICEGWGIELAGVLNDPARRQAMIRTARELAKETPRPASRDAYRRLLAATGNGRKVRASAHDKVVKGAAGRPLFRVRHQRASVALILPVQHVSARTLESIVSAISDILEMQVAKSCTATTSSVTLHI